MSGEAFDKLIYVIKMGPGAAGGGREGCHNMISDPILILSVVIGEITAMATISFTRVGYE
jgi:hypothetical protein